MNQDLKNAVLQEIQDQCGEATQESLRPIAGNDTMGAVYSLRCEGLITATRNKTTERNTYSTTPKGDRFLESLLKPQGKMPEPRTGPSRENYKPAPIAVRPGSMDAYSLPSHGRPRVRPVILGSSVIQTPLGR